MVTLPHAAARTSVPLGAAMSMPSWLRPQRGPNSDVTVPLTGEVSVDPHTPLTGVVPSRPPPADGVSDWPPAGASSASPPPTFFAGARVSSGARLSSGASVLAGALVRTVPAEAAATVASARPPAESAFELWTSVAGRAIPAWASICRPTVARRCSIRSTTCGETFDAPTAAPPPNSEPHVAGPTIPSTSRPERAWYWRTAVSVCPPKTPSAGIPSAF